MRCMLTLSLLYRQLRQSADSIGDSMSAITTFLNRLYVGVHFDRNLDVAAIAG